MPGAGHRLATALVALAAMGAAACSDSTAVESSARVTAVTANDNPSSTSSTTSGGSGSSTWSGSLTGTVQAQISTNAQTWVNIGSPATTSIALQSTGNVTTISTDARIPVGTYAYVRLVFSPGVQAQVTGTVGGTSYTARTVTFGSGELVIQKQVSPVTVTESSTLQVAWDLNAESWLTPTALQSQASTAAAVQSAAYAAITGP